MAPLHENAAALAGRLAKANEHNLAQRELQELMVQVDALFAAHQDRVYALCLRFTGNQEFALDLAQESMLRAYQKLPTFRGDSRFSTWLLSITRYECLNALRKRRDLLTEDGVVEATDGSKSALAHLRTTEREQLLRDAAATVLDPLEQEAVYLRYTEHVPLDQIERMLNLDSASGARGVLQRCKRKLKREVYRRLVDLGHGSSFLRGSFE
ncbi:MAG: RNA polymerase sigma-70 factor (ECF subfamily) [Kiritimatiellia bacterium]|jgi:RNA polymerase sigma-70 factor (ECF subfamily)